MKAPLLACAALCSLLGTTAAQTPGAPDPLGHFRFAPERLDPGTVTLFPQAGGRGVSYPTIQAAVDAAADGDTVLLSDGVYFGPGNRNVLITGKNVVVRSENGPEGCVIDCQSQGRGFHFLGPLVTNATLLSGVTITRASGGFGGAVYCEGGSAPTIEASHLVQNFAFFGAALHSLNANTVIRNCAIEANFAGSGAVFASGLIIERCVVRNNEADGNGAGIYVGSGTTVRNCVIVANIAAADGIGGDGGGIFIEGANTLVRGCTVANNRAQRAGGIFANASTGVVIENCILWGNTDRDGEPYPFYQFAFSQSPSARLQFCDIEGGIAALQGGPATVFFNTFAIMDEDPLFAGGGDFSLMPESPCIDAGRPDFVAATNEADIDNEPRIQAIVDMGSDEYWPGLVLGLVAPGRAGESNCVTVRGGEPGALALFFVGLDLGNTRLPFGSCPALAVGMADPSLLGATLVDAGGEATYSQMVPADLAATTIHLQAVVFDWAGTPRRCSVSNVVSFSYP